MGKVFYPSFSGSRDFGFVRLGGSGLANHLFIWGKAMVLARQTGGRVVFPAWMQIKLGPLLRREPDPRLYAGLFRAAGDDVRGLGKLLALIRRPRARIDHVREMQDRGDGLYVITSNGLATYFDELLDDRDLIRDALLRRTRRFGPRPDGAFIGLHVRLGDFAAAGAPGAVNTRLPLDWFIDRLRVLRAALDETLPAVICSDGSAEELAALLAEPGVSLRQGGDAMDDIWALSDAVAIIASGSTFSYWAGYLGDGVVVSRDGAWRADFTRAGDREWICGPEDRTPPAGALRRMRGLVG